MRGDRLTQAIEQIIAGEGTGSLEEALSENKKNVGVGNDPALVVNQIVVDEEEEDDDTLVDRGLQVIGDRLTEATQQVVVGEGVASL